MIAELNPGAFCDSPVTAATSIYLFFFEVYFPQNPSLCAASSTWSPDIAAQFI